MSVPQKSSSINEGAYFGATSERNQLPFRVSMM